MPQEKCVLCDEGITNPVCPECLALEMEQWFYERKPSLTKTIKDSVKIFKSFTHRSTRCILCGENMNVCAYCFTNDMYRWLKKKHVELADDFLGYFNYEIS